LIPEVGETSDLDFLNTFEDPVVPAIKKQTSKQTSWKTGFLQNKTKIIKSTSSCKSQDQQPIVEVDQQKQKSDDAPDKFPEGSPLLAESKPIHQIQSECPHPAFTGSILERAVPPKVSSMKSMKKS
jgi:hypothetical protein